MCNHCAVVNKKWLFRYKKLCISFFAHDCAHFLKTLIASYSAAEKQFFFPRVSHCPFSCFNKHRKNRFLSRICQIFFLEFSTFCFKFVKIPESAISIPLTLYGSSI